MYEGTQESYPEPSNTPALENLLESNFKNPYIRLNIGHTKAVLSDDVLRERLTKYIQKDRKPDGVEYMYMQIRNDGFPKLFDGLSQEEVAAFKKTLKEELHAGKMKGLIEVYRRRTNRWSPSGITTQEEVAIARKEALEALRQQHAVSVLPPEFLPDDFKPFKTKELEDAAVYFGKIDKIAVDKGIIIT